MIQFILHKPDSPFVLDNAPSLGMIAFVAQVQLGGLFYVDCQWLPPDCLAACQEEEYLDNQARRVMATVGHILPAHLTIIDGNTGTDAEEDET